MGDSGTEHPIWWTVAGFAKLTGVSRQAVYKWINSGKLSVSKVGKRFRITRAAVRRDCPDTYESIVLSEAERGKDASQLSQ